MGHFRYRKTIFLFIPVLIAAVVYIFALRVEENSLLLYVPLDARPVNLRYVAESVYALPKDLGFELRTPPLQDLPGQASPGTTDELWKWLLDNCHRAHTIVLSADTMIYGGLSSSRTHTIEMGILQKRMKNFEQIKKINPQSKIYVFTTIMRTPAQGGSLEEPDYYRQYGEKIFTYSALVDKELLGYISQEEKSQKDVLQAEIPEDILSDWLARREKNFSLNEQIIAYCKHGLIDYLVLCRDDSAAFSRSHMEYRELMEKASGLNNRRFTTFPGADEVGLLLITRAISTGLKESPAVYVQYAPGVGEKTIPAYEDQEIGKSIREKIAALNCFPTQDLDNADFVLAVNTPSDGITGEAGSEMNSIKPHQGVSVFAEEINDLLSAGKKVALADVSFSNGADNALMESLEKKGLLSRLFSYSGWNTAGNSVGYALAQAVLSLYMQENNKRELLLKRLVEDWAYQANIRQEVSKEVLSPQGITKNNLGIYQKDIEKETEARLLHFCARHLPEFGIKDIDIKLPWNRIFDIEVINIDF